MLTRLGVFFYEGVSQNVRKMKGVEWTLGIEKFFAQEVPYRLKLTQQKLLETDQKIQNQTKTIQKLEA